MQDYFPDLLALDRAIFPRMTELAGVFGEAFGDVEVRPVPIPADGVDGFTGACWRRLVRPAPGRSRAGHGWRAGAGVKLGPRVHAAVGLRR